ncbi:MAG: N-acetylmuramoyl-L-alanine amidase [Gammaproteobacteria bacterium]|nr:N-acetylmuramoyl-L-alanine amidase [Gammaproteobacteria bacterium]
MHEAPEYTRVVFDTSGPVKYDLFTLSDPSRVVIDLENASLAPGFDPGMAVLGRQRVKGMRAAPRGNGYRVVLDVTGKLSPKGFVLAPVPPYGHRLVVDLYSDSTDRAALVPIAQPAGRRDVVIAIDAGHGGDDPGALGVGRIREKHIVLSLAKQLATRFNEASGYRAVLVRKADYYVSLRRRMQIARAERADLFISIHADAFKSASVNGVSVYTLSDRGASSETARWLAEKENSSDLIGGVGDVSLDDKDDLLAHVLLDLSMDANRLASIEAGAAVLGKLGRVARLHKKRVEQAGFVVLKSPDIPSVLIETGYISNPAEARQLNRADYQSRIVGAIYAGLRLYFESSPPAGTLLAYRREQGDVSYTIESGDTLSGIAARYGTSAESIRRVNGLSTDRIRVGQVILIPTNS